MFFKISEVTITLNISLEIHHLDPFFQNGLIVLLEILLKDLFLKEEMPIGLMGYLQYLINKLIEFILLLNQLHYRLL